MNFDAMNRQLKVARRSRNVFAAFGMLLLVIVMLLSATLMTTHRTTVLVPSRVSDGMVSNGHVDPRYVEAIALDAVYSFFNSSPESTAYGRQALERIASIRTRPTLLDAYDEVADDIRERKITTVFFVNEIEHDWTALEVTVKGSLSTYIETSFVTREDREVVLRFAREASSVRLADFEVLVMEG
ncbi:TraE/TraK family type IV conjugative transfer system protein [uncultured Roseobacter sp.]|uniref:TraE/TraK family type IV conjugative transfer system protein n=1 Tax=uncultured Roseobacter sp. TaxID=114847 RepID=UPI00262CD5BD|nr:TraE/TraK family type IV conjugative transfer system protein [uncultured Roseobacter sp.]